MAALLSCRAARGSETSAPRRPWEDLPPGEAKRLVAQLESEDGDERLEAARALGEAGEPKAVGPILKALKRELLTVGIPGVRALALIGDPRAAKPLLDIYLAPYLPPPDMPQAAEIVPLMRAVMLYTIGSLGCLEGEKVLVDRYRSEPSLLFRTRIAQALGLLGTDEAFRALLESTGSGAPTEVRRLGVTGLGLIGDGRAARAIQSLYEQEQDEAFRAYMLYVLSGMPVADPGEWVRERLGPGTLDPRGRSANVTTRIRLGDEEAIRWRLAALAAKEAGTEASEEVVQFPDCLFDTASALLTPSATAVIDGALGAFLAEGLASSPLRIRGYADDRGSERYNLDLSRRRAEAVRAYLATRGIGPDDRFDLAALGESEPDAPNDTDDGRRKNRRVEWSTVRKPAEPAAAYVELKLVLQGYAEGWRTTHREPQRTELGTRLVRLASRENMGPLIRELALRAGPKDAEATAILRALRILSPGLIEKSLAGSPARPVGGASGSAMPNPAP